MEESYNLSCQHSLTYKYLSRKSIQEHFCVKCGCLFLENESYAIKPNKMKYSLETSPIEVFAKMKNIYVNEIASINFFQKDGITSDYLKIRKKTLIPKMKIFINKFKFKDTSLHLAIFLMDYIIGNCGNENEVKAELVAIGSLILSCKIFEKLNVVKYTELDQSLPNLSCYQVVFDTSYYTIDKIRNAEIFCLKKLNYKLDFVLPIHFLQCLMLNGIIFLHDFTSKNPLENELRHYTRIYSFVSEILDFTIESKIYVYYNKTKDISYKDISFFHIACSCVALAREIVKIPVIWNETFELVYGIKYEEFAHVFDFVKSNYFNARSQKNVICLYIKNEPQLSAIATKKYSSKSIGPKQSVKDLKIIETKKYELETIKSIGHEVNLTHTLRKNRRDKAKSQDMTIINNYLKKTTTAKEKEIILQVNSRVYLKEVLEKDNVTPIKKQDESKQKFSQLNTDTEKGNSPNFYNPGSFSRNFAKYAVHKMPIKARNNLQNFSNDNEKEEIKSYNYFYRRNRGNNSINREEIICNKECKRERDATYHKRNDTTNMENRISENISDLLPREHETKIKSKGTFNFNSINSITQNFKLAKDVISLDGLTPIKMNNLINNKLVKIFCKEKSKASSCNQSQIQANTPDVSKSELVHTPYFQNSIIINASTKENSHHKEPSIDEKMKACEHTKRDELMRDEDLKLDCNIQQRNNYVINKLICNNIMKKKDTKVFCIDIPGRGQRHCIQKL